MSGTTWTKFYWSDWDTDPALRLCSFAAQGLWMRMLCIAASHDPIGYVAVAGRALEATDIARMTGGSEGDVQTLLAELDRNGVCSRDRHGRIYSRRMVRDAKAAAMARKNGKLGGNPSLSKHKGNQPWDNPPDKTRLKTHKPLPDTRTKVEAPNRASNLGYAEEAARPEGATSPRPKLELVEKEPIDVRRAVIAEAMGRVVRPVADPPAESPAQMAERLRKAL
jgi:hypothetical protein